jgi:uncharacterized protein with HEPN domain
VGLSDRDRRHVEFILECIDKIHEYQPSDRNTFLADSRTHDAITWRLQAIADASRTRLTDEIRNRHAEIGWRAVYGFRNIAAHRYAEIDLDLVWEIITEHLEPLRLALQSELE